MWTWYQHLFSSRQTGKRPFNAIGPWGAACRRIADRISQPLECRL